MSKDTLVVGDSVFNSPVGTGTVTGITQAGYPQVNDIAVGRMVHKTEDGKFLVFDPNNTYSKGDWEMFIDDERYPSESVSKSVVIVRSSQEAIAFCNIHGTGNCTTQELDIPELAIEKLTALEILRSNEK